GPHMGSNRQELKDVCAPLEKDDIRRLSQAFHRFGIVTVTELIEPHTRKLVRAEADRLLDQYAERRDLRLATTDYTRRSMSVVPSETIAANSELVTGLYAHRELLAPLEAIAGERLHPCPKADEEFLITRQEQRGDTHGWHWGDFSFALIWVLQAPPIDVGGLLQCVPHTTWDKASPQINRYLVENPIDTYHFESGDVYFLRTDTTLHRTIPLREDTTRIILNMTWAGERDLSRKLAADDRWWDNAEVSAARAIKD
uniref:BesD, lysine halogenase n=1 Tax=Streptantibioticus cattleyicolor (strain ATCC 35852 / DSM 46488 / JCM 4925 / NBRC 14057 / NRRL 8057) TaxID=1003195 RepID=UPI00123EDC32|nr:Chain A, BesD, lysine halogenase [Streptantibioticus cattleyicolor NRRL 8057 = DSM 46488]6NIE_B Chain B, BesD, lysine halogenase [Streptantibioticus cattleyicolor NRRL 8057 = DSM 46488]6NIE_C Chain C, BesD, lysine halogenase [Streptantibioticus cattleyicolor NRRL 8057 = DSM 46488]6NIE_D Chain D, BesD, lysine halogenase [Streptantibioticus cattleyicolor NRRL 8057 = DSM 46488]